MATMSRRDWIRMTGAAALVSPTLLKAQPRVPVPVLQNMDWVWGQGRENVESAPAFEALVQYLWGIRTWWDVLRGVAGVGLAIATGQPGALPLIVVGQSTSADPNGAKERLKGVHGDDAGARGSYDAYYPQVGPNRFFRTFLTCALAGPNWGSTQDNIRWQCENNPFSSVVAARIFARGHSEDRDVVNALYWLNCGQYHSDAARVTYRRAANANITRLFGILDRQIVDTRAVERVEEAARRRREALDSYDPHPAPGRPDPVYLHGRRRRR